jgi:hypothetical protein
MSDYDDLDERLPDDDHAFARAVEREARREALEEAARVCDHMDPGAYPHLMGEACAAAIRALIDKEPRT